MHFRFPFSGKSICTRLQSLGFKNCNIQCFIYIWKSFESLTLSGCAEWSHFINHPGEQPLPFLSIHCVKSINISLKMDLSNSIIVGEQWMMYLVLQNCDPQQCTDRIAAKQIEPLTGKTYDSEDCDRFLRMTWFVCNFIYCEYKVGEFRSILMPEGWVVCSKAQDQGDGSLNKMFVQFVSSYNFYSFWYCLILHVECQSYSF